MRIPILTAIVLAYGSPEPYGAVIALLLPPALVLAWGALSPVRGDDGRSANGRQGWGAAIGTGMFLGVAATFYTLYLGLAAFAVTVMAVAAAGADGVLIEVHPEPDRALSDGAQSLYPDQFTQLVGELRAVAAAIGRSVPSMKTGTA